MKPIPFVLLLSSLAGFAAHAKAAEADAPAAEQPREFTIPLDRQQMIGVTYATAETKRCLCAPCALSYSRGDATTAVHWD